MMPPLPRAASLIIINHRRSVGLVGGRVVELGKQPPRVQDQTPGTVRRRSTLSNADGQVVRFPRLASKGSRGEVTYTARTMA